MATRWMSSMPRAAQLTVKPFDHQLQSVYGVDPTGNAYFCDNFLGLGEVSSSGATAWYIGTFGHYNPIYLTPDPHLLATDSAGDAFVQNGLHYDLVRGGNTPGVAWAWLPDPATILDVPASNVYLDSSGNPSAVYNLTDNLANFM